MPFRGNKHESQTWSPERKAAHAEAMRTHWATGVYAKRRPPSIADAERAARSARASISTSACATMKS
jgi:hypothetical protein